METNPFFLKVFNPDEDYATLCEWWGARGLAAIPLAMLPRLGVVALSGDTPVAAAFLYMDNSGSGVCFLEGTVTKRGLGFLQARRAVQAAVGFLEREGTALGYSRMYAFAEERLEREMKRMGFWARNEKFRCFFKELDHLVTEKEAE